MDEINVLAFDTGGTVLDWHGGIVGALVELAAQRGIEHDWHEFANEYRRRSLQRMLGAVHPSFNIDDVHRDILDELVIENGISTFSRDDRERVAGCWHRLEAWPDFVPALARLRQRYVCVSFTILSLSLGIHWDAVLACETLGIYKPRAEAYERVATLLATPPRQILMVACHNFDLDAARAAGYRTAFVHRPAEWGPAGPPDPVPNPATDLVVSGFAELAERLGQ